jgi:hypothetical protein
MQVMIPPCTTVKKDCPAWDNSWFVAGNDRSSFQEMAGSGRFLYRSQKMIFAGILIDGSPFDLSVVSSQKEQSIGTVADQRFCFFLHTKYNQYLPVARPSFFNSSTDFTRMRGQQKSRVIDKIPCNYVHQFFCGLNIFLRLNILSLNRD